VARQLNVWHRRTDWYLGYDDTSGGSRALAALERLIVADLVDVVASAEFEIRRATSVRPARFVGQEVGDNRLWLAALLPNGCYRIRGEFFGTYRADELDLRDEQAGAEFRAFLSTNSSPEKSRRPLPAIPRDRASGEG
jgi:hypothetical protein